MVQLGRERETFIYPSDLNSGIERLNMGRFTGKTCRLLTMMVLTTSFFLVEIVTGYATKSVALIADSFHMLSDIIALIVGFTAIKVGTI